MILNLKKIVTLLSLLGASFPVNAFPLNYNVGETFRYSYVTEMRFNEPEHYLKSKQRPDLGLKISANLDLTAVWSDSTGLLMELKVASINQLCYVTAD